MAGGGDYNCHCYFTNNYPTVGCSTQHPYCSVRKLVRLIESTSSEQQMERKRMILHDFLNASPCGFWMQDIPFVDRLVELILEDETLLSSFHEPLERIMCLYSIPPMLARSSEVLNCKRDLTEHFNFLTYLLVSAKEEDIKNLSLRALWCLLDSNPLPAKRCVSLALRHEVIGESHLVETLAELLRIEDEENYSILLKFALLLAQASEAAGFMLMEKEVINTVMLRLEPNWSTRNVNFSPLDFICSGVILNCDTALKLLWILLRSLKTYSEESLKKLKPLDQQSLWSFQYALYMLIQKKHSEIERNQCLAIILLCLLYVPRSAFVQSGLVYDIVKIGVFAKITIDEHEICLTSTDADFQFKKMALLSLCFSVNNISALSIYHDCEIVKHLLESVMPETKTVWIKEQQRKLIVISLGVLQRLVPHLGNDFADHDVFSSLLVLTKYYVGRMYDLEILLAVLKCLHSVVLRAIQKPTNTIAEETMTDLIINFSSQKQIEQIHHKCINYCLSILVIFYKNHSVRNLPLIRMTLDYMKRNLNPSAEDFGHDPTTMICLFDLLWNGLLTNEDNLRFFVKSGCVYALLDLIERSVYPVKLVGLGLLTDLCEEGSCIPHVLTWRSKGMTVTSLLMSIFREECRMIRVKTDEHGILEDTELPIMGIRQYQATKAQNKDLNASPATIDFILSARPKIYAILQLLKYRHKDTVELVNEHYKLQYQPLPYKDQITKLLAENYFQFKLGEVWCEINGDLQSMGLKPLEVDGRTMETLIRKHYHLSMKVKEIQEEILKRKLKEDKINEYMVYKMLKESKLCSALCALKELDYMARVTEHMIRHLKKGVLRQQIKDSLDTVDTSNIHQTFMYNIGVTSVFGLVANVESDINKKKEKKSDSNLGCVSPDDSKFMMEENLLFEI